MKDIISAVDKHQKLILDTERYIWRNPETGYKEFKTDAYMKKVFRDLGYEITDAEGITGFYTMIDTGRQGPTILILGELDAIICPDHKDADKQTGAVHSCGHNAQCAALVGVAAALKEPNVLDKLCGKIMLCAVPAEELLEIEYRTKLKEQGIIKCLGGKSEFLRRGYFDNVDIAFMVHTSTDFMVKLGFIGCVVKRITFTGKAAHAGSSPWEGANALYAANCGLNAINALRETFKESDIIRVHPIITNGGAMVNAIPETVTLESYVRGKTFEGIKETNHKVNRALCGAALSLGTNVDITDIPGYTPLCSDKNLMDITVDAAKKSIPHRDFKKIDALSSGSTDMGDLSAIMPVIHPYVSGAVGTAHGNDFYIADPVAACIDSAKLQLGILLALLENGAEKAYRVVSEYKAPFKSREEFFSYLDDMCSSGNRIDYSCSDSVTINIK